MGMKLIFCKMLMILLLFSLSFEAFADPCSSPESIQTYDYNGDGVLDREDVESFRSDLKKSLYGKSKPSSTKTALGEFDFEERKPELGSEKGLSSSKGYRLDINDDQRVDVLDSVQFFKVYRKCSKDGDINRDGTIDVQDLQFLMSLISSKEGKERKLRENRIK